MAIDKTIGAPPPLGYRLAWQPFWRTAAWILLLLVVILSVVPSGMPTGFDGGDKLQHLSAYMILGFFFAVLYPRRRPVVLLGLLLLGVLLEAVQGLLPVRVASPFDMLANTLGVLLGGLLAGSPAGGLFVWLESRLMRARGIRHSNS